MEALHSCEWLRLPLAFFFDHSLLAVVWPKPLRVGSVRAQTLAYTWQGDGSNHACCISLRQSFALMPCVVMWPNLLRVGSVQTITHACTWQGEAKHHACCISLRQSWCRHARSVASSVAPWATVSYSRNAGLHGPVPHGGMRFRRRPPIPSASAATEHWCNSRTEESHG